MAINRFEELFFCVFRFCDTSTLLQQAKYRMLSYLNYDTDNDGQSQVYVILPLKNDIWCNDVISIARTCFQVQVPIHDIWY